MTSLVRLRFKITAPMHKHNYKPNYTHIIFHACAMKFVSKGHPSQRFSQGVVKPRDVKQSKSMLSPINALTKSELSPIISAKQV